MDKDIVVVKIGGELLDTEESAQNFVQGIRDLAQEGITLVIVHGGGPQITRLMERFSLTPRFLNGQRVTDKETIELMAMAALGKINAELVAKLNANGVRSLGLSGADCRLVLVDQMHPDLGFVGKVRTIDAEFLRKLCDMGLVPVIAPLGVDDAGQLYNMNADIIAGGVAAALGARKLVVLTNVDGLYLNLQDKTSLIPEITTEKAKSMIKSGKVHAGMIPKLEGIIQAVESGVNQAHIINGFQARTSLPQVCTAEGRGTVVRMGA